jgi:hypothetical protein
VVHGALVGDVVATLLILIGFELASVYELADIAVRVTLRIFVAWPLM